MTMNYPSEKADSFTDYPYNKDKDYDVDVSSMKTSSSAPRYSKFDITQPQAYDLRSTKTDWIYSGAYSLRLARDDPNSEAWNVKIHMKSLEVFRADGSQVGTVGLSCWSSKVQVHLDEAESVPDFQMKGKGFCVGEKKFFDLHGQQYMWKRASKLGSKFELKNEAGDVVAWAGPTSWKGRYRFELVQGGFDVDTVEAILLTALATLENEKRRMWAASSASSSSAASSVAISA